MLDLNHPVLLFFCLKNYGLLSIKRTYVQKRYFSRMNIAIGVPWKSQWSRMRFSRKRR